MTKRLFLLSICLLALCGPARAHGSYESSEPKAGRTLKTVPDEVVIEFSEDPAAESSFEVIDGCGELVGSKARLDGHVVVIPVAELSGGRDWKVTFRVISAQDGHVTKDSFRFSIGGSGCLAPPPTSPQASPAEIATDSDESGSSFPIVPVVIGAVALVGAGFGLRSLTGRREP